MRLEIKKYSAEKPLICDFLLSGILLLVLLAAADVLIGVSVSTYAVCLFFAAFYYLCTAVSRKLAWTAFAPVLLMLICLPFAFSSLTAQIAEFINSVKTAWFVHFHTLPSLLETGRTSFFSSAFLAMLISISICAAVRKFGRGAVDIIRIAAVLTAFAITVRLISDNGGGRNYTEAFSPQGNPTLEVVMDSPEPMYIHGFLGYKYDSAGGWSEPDFKRLSDGLEDIYALDRAGYTADSQSVILAQLSSNISLNNITVRNIGADTKYVYTPVSSSGPEPSYALGLENRSGFFKSKRSVSVQTIENLSEVSGKFPYMVKALQNGGSNKAESEKYLAAAQKLGELYHKNFTEIPADTRRVLEAQLSDYKAEQGSLSDAVNVIYDYLGGFDYDENVGGISAEEFMQVGRAGYSVHFASAATLILRYYGIAARYAEGYIVTSDAAQGMLSGSPIKLTDGDFHAWTEYYLDGAGWIPLEVTPEYFDKMPLPAGVSADGPDYRPANNNISAQGTEKTSGERLAKEIKNEPAQDDEVSFMLPCKVIFLVLVGMMIWIVWRRKRLVRLCESDKSYAIMRCAKALGGVIPDAGGQYDFSFLILKASENEKIVNSLDNLQDMCENEYYSKDFEGTEKPFGGYGLYKRCRALRASELSVYERVVFLLKELLIK